MPNAVDALRAAAAKLTGPGGPFELAVEAVLGEPMRVFKNRARSLRELLERSAPSATSEYVVYEERRLELRAASARRRVGRRARCASATASGRGDRVAILAANCPEWVIAFWAAREPRRRRRRR